MRTAIIDPATGRVAVNDIGNTLFIHTENSAQAKQKLRALHLGRRAYGRILISDDRTTMVYIISQRDSHMACNFAQLVSSMDGFKFLRLLTNSTNVQSTPLNGDRLRLGLLSTAALAVVGFTGYHMYRWNAKINELKSKFNHAQNALENLKNEHNLEMAKTSSEIKRLELELVSVANKTAQKLVDTIFFRKSNYSTTISKLITSDMFKTILFDREKISFRGTYLLLPEGWRLAVKFSIVNSCEKITIDTNMLYCYIVCVSDGIIDGHASALFVSDNRVYHFDPQRQLNNTYDMYCTKWIESLITNKKYDFFRNVYAPQLNDPLAQKTEKDNKISGYCLAWSTFVIAWIMEHGLESIPEFESSLEDFVTKDTIGFIRRFASMLCPKTA